MIVVCSPNMNFNFLQFRLRKINLLSFFLLLFIGHFSQAQIKTEIDTAHIKIGEPIHYKLTVPLRSNQEIKLPELKDTLTFHIEILDQKIDTVLVGEKKSLVQRLTLTSYDPGDFLIRSLPVVVNSDTLLSNALQISVDDVEIDSANMAGFPIKPIMDEEYTLLDYWDRYWIYLVIAAIIFVALLLVTILFLRNKKNKFGKHKRIKTPYEEAKSSLIELDNRHYLEKGQENPYYSELSYILRRYLGRIYNFSSLELLSDDLVHYVQNHKHLDENQVEELKQFLYESDLVKFAKAKPELGHDKLYRRWVEDLIEMTKPMELEDETVHELRPNENYRKIR